MNKKLLLSVITVAAFGLGVQAQEKVKKEEAVQQEIKKEVKMEEKNGEKTLTITSIENGIRTEEVYKGEEAQQKLDELMANHGELDDKQKERIEVKMEEIGGKKILTVETTKNGEKTVEKFEGLEAEKKLKELGGNLEEVEPTGSDVKVIKKEKKVLKKESM